MAILWIYPEVFPHREIFIGPVPQVPVHSLYLYSHLPVVFVGEVHNRDQYKHSMEYWASFQCLGKYNNFDSCLFEYPERVGLGIGLPAFLCISIIHPIIIEGNYE